MTGTPVANVADTFEFAASVTVHIVAVPEQLLPLHPLKYWPEPGASVSMILVFVPKFAVQVPGQLMPAGLLITVPVPETATVSESPPLNAAETLVAAVSVSVHVLAVPEQFPPLQPEKKLLAAGFSVRVTCEFEGKLAEHVPGHVIPPGVLVTLPVLAVGPVTVNWTEVFAGVGEVPSPWQPASEKRRARRADVASAVFLLDVMATSFDVSECGTVVSWPRGEARTQGSGALLRENTHVRYSKTCSTRSGSNVAFTVAAFGPKDCGRRIVTRQIASQP